MAESAKWYVVHTYSGYENAVKTSIEKFVTGRGCTGFVGPNGKPIPLTEEEVLAMGMEKHEIVVKYNVGDHVKIVDGPLASFTGVVEEIEPEKNRVSVMVSMFGRETPVELELDQVEVQD